MKDNKELKRFLEKFIYNNIRSSYSIDKGAEMAAWFYLGGDSDSYEGLLNGIRGLTVKFAEWKDKNFYQRTEKKEIFYYPQITSAHFDITKLTQFQPQDKITLEKLYSYWVGNILKLEENEQI